ncbi:MAG: COX15/CtaA family protein [Actinobacteria bacterium]|nr:COX15/CtaA family protein [Actinomycetota bacterium]MDA2951471.1 COX15/CtaA family protein [Actinomycetota bacterium]MDA2998388.1 COX15/CtaA family protein [Actinomycetota bacterium]
MRRPQVSVNAYERAVWLALGALIVIIISGSLVRLTGSGLGCSDWPNCNNTRFIDVSSGHAAIEQINRLFTGVVALSVAGAVALSLLLAKPVRKITNNAILLVIGVIAQVIIGAYVVLTGLNPWTNMVHFLVSFMLVTAAVVLLNRTRTLSSGVPPIDRQDVALKKALFSSAMISVVLGTVVTGSGPHSGSEAVTRLDISVRFATQLHSIAVWITVAISVLLAIRARRSVERWGTEGARIQFLLFSLVSQGFIGYVQYFAGVPAHLVAIHIAGSVMVWLAVLAVFLPTTRLNVLD